MSKSTKGITGFRCIAWLVMLAGHAVAMAQQGHPPGSPRLVVQTGHAEAITGLAFSANGQVIASSSIDKTIKLWDVRSGRELRTIGASEYAVNAVAYAPSGTSVAYGDGDGNVGFANPATGSNTASIACAGVRNGAQFQVKALAYSPEGKQLAAACADKIELYLSPEPAARSDNSIVVWKVASGREVLRLNEQAAAPVAVHFSSDGRMLVSGKADGTVRLWDAVTGKSLADWKGHKGRVYSVAMSPDRRLVASAGFDQTIRLWDPETGRQARVLENAGGPVTHLAFTPDGSRLASVGQEGVVQIWRMPQGQLVETLPTLAGLQHTLAFSHDGRHLAISSGASFTIWETNGWQKSREFSSSASEVLALALAPDEKSLAIGNQGKGSVAIWNLSNGKLSRRLASPGTPVAGHPGGGLAFAPNGNVLASMSGGSVQLWPVDGDAPPRTLPIGKNFNGPLAFAPDGSAIAVGGWHNLVSVLDLTTGAAVRQLAPQGGLDVSHSQIHALSYAYDGRSLVSAGSAGGIDVWELATARRRCHLRKDIGSVMTTAFFRHDRILASGHADGAIVLWDVQECRELLTLDGSASGDVNGLALSANGQLMASAGNDNAIQLWDLDNARLLRTLQGHTNSVQAAVFTGDNRMLFSASIDGTVRLWRVADGALLATLAAFSDGRWAVTSPDGRFDVADLEDMPHLHWVIQDDPMTPLPLEVFMRDYYEPGLLSRILSGEKFKAVRTVASLNRLQPQVRIVGIEADPRQADFVRVTVEAAGARRSGGMEQPPISTAVHDLRLFRDGQLVGYADGRLAEAGSKPFSKTFLVRLPGGAAPRTFSAYAFNDDRIKSTTVRLDYRPPVPITAAKPRAYLINIGVNRHDNPAWDLRYAANDALEIGHALAARLAVQGKYDAIVRIALISDAGSHHLATKANIKAVIDALAGRQPAALAIPGAEQLRRATPDDLVLISFSGHGYGDGGLFYLVPSGTGAGQGKRFTPELAARAISSDELSVWLRDVDAGDLTMIVDACHSAASVGADFKPGPMGSRGLGQLAFDKGMRLLAASQADDVALESDLIQHGLLSFALLQNGLEAQLADHQPRDHQVMLAEWLSYGVVRVPALAEEVKKGELAAAQSAGTARGAVLVTGGGIMKKRVIQQPSLFDFTKGRRDVKLLDVAR